MAQKKVGGGFKPTISPADKEKMKEKESSLKIQGAKKANAEKVPIPVLPAENDDKYKARLQTYLVNFLTILFEWRMFDTQSL